MNSEDHHRYQSSDEEDFQESVDKAVTLSKPIVIWSTTPTPSTSISSTASSPEPRRTCSTLIIGTASGGSSLLHTIKAKTLLGNLTLPGVDPKDNAVDLNAQSKTSCNIYGLDSDPTVIMIACNYDIKDHESLNFAKVIMNSIQASRIIILDTFSPSTYISGSPDIEYNYPWMRLLQTTGSTTVTKMLALEVPNLVQNLGAALMSYCEVRGLNDTYLLLSLQEHIYGKALTTTGTLRGLQEGLSSLGCPSVASQMNVAGAVYLLQDKRVGSNRMRDDRLYA